MSRFLLIAALVWLVIAVYTARGVATGEWNMLPWSVEYQEPSIIDRSMP